ncbi:hydrolase [Actinoplanes sp. OR16]|uniref:SGNH/GDSL hydrolase family protein n=1 Tax=Actinoplanes sp. OR16 TaxID=946334 RepID=UPI000F71570D|nr:SGNH/GDSL hydrolase family protein [Actinoplanes sp. OR16]BBH69218.1 hydrolase [Actinoplanes sp. OR16]
MALPLLYAALGSSFASGPGIDPIVDAEAMRSGANYPHLLAQRLGATLIDLSVSGATTATILDQPQVTISGARFAPQIEGVPPDAGLVTVTAGGNDLRYMTAMMFTAWNRVRPGGPAARMLAADLPDGLPAPTPADVARTAAGLAEIVDRVRSRAPRARVLLVDYLTVLGDAPVPEPFDLPVFREIQSALESAYVTAAAASGAGLVAVSAISRGHALGSASPWIHPFSPTAAGAYSSLHPNAAGMTAVAAAVVEHLG